MAIRYRKEYGTWQVYWTNPISGKRESKTYATEEEAKKQNSLVLHRLKYEQESFRQEALQKTEEPTLDKVYIQYLEEKQFTKKVLARHLQLMRPALKMLGAKRIADITTEDLEHVRESLQKKTTLAPASVRGHLSVLRTIIYYAVRKKLCPAITFPQIPAPQYKQFVPPTTSELTAMYDAAPAHIKRVIILGAYVGVRVGPCELFQLTWEDVDLGRRTVRVHGARKNTNATWREVPIQESLMPMFEEWQREDLATGDQYLIHVKRVKGSIASIKRAWTTTLLKAGITRRIRPYDLRHAFATELIAAGVDIGTVAKLMGHSSPDMILKHYQYVMDKQKRAAVEVLPLLGSMCRANVPRNLA